MGGSGRAKRAMPTLAAKSAANMGHPDCAGSGEERRLRGGFAGVVGYGLLEVGLELGFDEGERQKWGVVEDFDGELAIGMGVFGRDAVFGEGAGGAGQLDAVGAEPFGGRGVLGIGHGNLDHAKQCTLWQKSRSPSGMTEKAKATTDADSLRE